MATDKLTLNQKEKMPAYQLYMLLSYLVVLVNIGVTIGFYKSLQPQIPIFYSLADAAEQLAKKEWIFLAPAIGLMMAILHSLIIAINRKYDEFLWLLFALITLVFELMLLAISLRIIWLVS